MTPTSKLSDMATGDRARMVLRGGDVRYTRRCAELGLLDGCEVSIVQSSGGPVVLAIRGSRIALGRALAERLGAVRLDHSTP